MEWLTLILVVPAILVPVVLLWGFAGCSFSVHVPPPPDAPFNVTATATSTSEITVTWENSNVDAVTFEIDRTKEGEGPSAPIPSAITTFNDTGLQAGTTYSYQVRAIKNGSSSAQSDPAVSASTFFFVAFEATLATDQPGLEGFCLVQRIEAARLLHGGTRVAITLRGSTAGSLTLNNVFMSQPASVGDPYDSAADLTPVASAVVVPASTPVRLPEIAYNLDPTRPLLIAFDVSSTPASGNVRFVTNVAVSDAAMFFNAATAEAGTPDRLPSATDPAAPKYQPSPSIYLVEKIEVA